MRNIYFKICHIKKNYKVKLLGNCNECERFVKGLSFYTEFVFLTKS